MTKLFNGGAPIGVSSSTSLCIPVTVPQTVLRGRHHFRSPGICILSPTARARSTRRCCSFPHILHERALAHTGMSGLGIVVPQSVLVSTVGALFIGVVFATGLVASFCLKVFDLEADNHLSRLYGISCLQVYLYYNTFHRDGSILRSLVSDSLRIPSCSVALI
jgi:hypothetical protein